MSESKFVAYFKEGDSEHFYTKLPTLESLKANKDFISTRNDNGERVLINLNNVLYMREW